jgi:ABC-type phosphate/phosphonate transport system substrate-binding protein
LKILRIASCMAQSADPFCVSIVDLLAEKLSITVELIDDISWQERERLFDSGHIHICWICGLPYVWKRDLARPAVELLAAPVMKGERYQNRPVSFSDVVVRSDSRFRTFEDLRGARWAYNEPRSHSGYQVVRERLSLINETLSFFGQVVESGAHHISLDMILARRIDGSAIDSTVLESLLEQRPEIARHLTVIETLGPSPMPPWICNGSLPANVRDDVRSFLLNMHLDERGRRILDSARVSHFALVEDRFYDAIRRSAG